MCIDLNGDERIGFFLLPPIQSKVWLNIFLNSEMNWTFMSCFVVPIYVHTVFWQVSKILHAVNLAIYPHLIFTWSIMIFFSSFRKLNWSTSWKCLQRVNVRPTWKYFNPIQPLLLKSSDLCSIHEHSLSWWSANLRPSQFQWQIHTLFKHSDYIIMLSPKTEDCYFPAEIVFMIFKLFFCKTKKKEKLQYCHHIFAPINSQE